MLHDEVVEAARMWLHIPFKRIALTEIGLPTIGLSRDAKRADVLSYEPGNSRNMLRIIECKATASDARRLPLQLAVYSSYANFLYVAAPRELAEKLRDTLPKGVGLLAVSDRKRWDNDNGSFVCDVLRNPRRSVVDERLQSRMHARVLTYLLAEHEKYLARARGRCLYCGRKG